MKTLEFNVDIDAPRQTVWTTLWDDATYREWTKAFSEDSHAISDWKEGSRIQFQDGTGNGIYADIITCNQPTQMTFKQLGELKDGKETPKEWSGALEDYQLTETESGTHLKVSLDITDEYAEMMKSMFPKALAALKRIAEKKTA